MSPLRWVLVASTVGGIGLALVSFSLGVTVGSGASPQVIRWATAGSAWAGAILAGCFLVSVTIATRRGKE